MFLRVLYSLLLFVALSPLHAFALTPEELYRKVENSILSIYAMDYQQKKVVMGGTAVAITEYTLVTNCHIALAGNYLVVKVKDKIKLAPLFYHSKEEDMCFVQVPGERFEPVTLRPSADVQIGEDVYAVGNPRGLERSLSRGLVSNKVKKFDSWLLQTDAQIAKGSSGGGLFDKDGNLIGITFGTLKSADNVTFAIPTEWIIDIVKTVKVAPKKE